MSPPPSGQRKKTERRGVFPAIAAPKFIELLAVTHEAADPPFPSSSSIGDEQTLRSMVTADKSSNPIEGLFRCRSEHVAIFHVAWGE